jgi:putative transposase
MLLILRYLFVALGVVVRARRDLALENIALRHQLEVLARAPLRPADRLLWSSLSRIWPIWRRHVVIVQPDTVVRWHRTAWRRYWSWRSRGPRPGRPRIDAELVALIRQMTRENPHWGHMRVLGELRKLGFRVGLQTVWRYCKNVPHDPTSSWRTFLTNHRPALWASDFLTVHTLSF